jgi:hypothetical protein
LKGYGFSRAAKNLLCAFISHRHQDIAPALHRSVPDKESTERPSPQKKSRYIRYAATDSFQVTETIGAEYKKAEKSRVATTATFCVFKSIGFQACAAIGSWVI